MFSGLDPGDPRRWMRAVLVAVMFAAAACEGQLNPEWCATHTDDQDCINAGLVQVDASPSCKDVPCSDRTRWSATRIAAAASASSACPATR